MNARPVKSRAVVSLKPLPIACLNYLQGITTKDAMLEAFKMPVVTGRHTDTDIVARWRPTYPLNQVTSSGAIN